MDWILKYLSIRLTFELATCCSNSSHFFLKSSSSNFIRLRPSRLVFPTSAVLLTTFDALFTKNFMPDRKPEESAGFSLMAFLSSSSVNCHNVDQRWSWGPDVRGQSQELKKIRGQGPTFWGQTLLRPRLRTKDTIFLNFGRSPTTIVLQRTKQKKDHRAEVLKIFARFRAFSKKETKKQNKKNKVIA